MDINRRLKLDTTFKLGQNDKKAATCMHSNERFNVINRLGIVIIYQRSNLPMVIKVRLMQSAAYCNHTSKVPFSNGYKTKKPLLSSRSCYNSCIDHIKRRLGTVVKICFGNLLLQKRMNAFGSLLLACSGFRASSDE